jgi:hypothetical protein
MGSMITDYERQLVQDGINIYRRELEDLNQHSEDALRAALLHVIKRVIEDSY